MTERSREGAGRFARLDDHRRLGQGAHCDVALREEQSVLRRGLAGVAQDRDLGDDQMFGGDALLQLPVLARIILAERRADHGDGAPLRS